MGSIFNRAKALWTFFLYPILCVCFHHRIAFLAKQNKRGIFYTGEVEDANGTIPQFMESANWKLFLFCFLHYGLTVMIQTGFASGFLKSTIRRKRPDAVRVPGRKIESLRAHEKNSHAMPSGDTGFGAFFLTITALVFAQHYLLALIPFVALARIYFHCHWVFDTVVGGFIGVMSGAGAYHLLPFYASLLL
jgi:membrane-associated phospholipid phosphatase